MGIPVHLHWQRRNMPLRAPSVPLAWLLLLVAAVSVVGAAHEQQKEDMDPEVTACRQQCARQRRFGPAERRHCLRQCDEYGRAKRHEVEEEEPERERDRCLHECRAGPPKPGCERRCRDAYDRATGCERWRPCRPAGLLTS